MSIDLFIIRFKIFNGITILEFIIDLFIQIVIFKIFKGNRILEFELY